MHDKKHAVTKLDIVTGEGGEPSGEKASIVASGRRQASPLSCVAPVCAVYRMLWELRNGVSRHSAPPKPWKSQRKDGHGSIVFYRVSAWHITATSRDEIARANRAGSSYSLTIYT